MNNEDFTIPEVPKNIHMIALTGCSTSGKTTLSRSFENHFKEGDTKITVVH